MERLERSTITFVIRNYCMLTKPGIILGNALTAAAGFALVSRGIINLWLFLATLIGLSLVIGSACVFNNYIDRELDAKMSRTKNRPLAKGVIPIKHALVFGALLGVYGTLLLAIFVNLLTAAIALFGFYVYVFLYSFKKHYTSHATLIGSIAGAVPPVVGYTAVHNGINLAAFILFMMVVMWQMPHFFAIAIYRLEDYHAASIPVLPIKKGITSTKVVMLLYIIGFILSASMLPLFGYTGYAFLIVMSLLGLIWLLFSIQGFTCHNDRSWARKMFFFSLVIVLAFCVMMPFSVL